MLTPQMLQVDLTEGLVLHSRGYDAARPVLAGSTVEAGCRMTFGDREAFINGRFFSTAPHDIEVWVESYSRDDVARWAARVDGDFNVAVWDRRQRTLDVVSDRTGANRLYVHADAGLVTLTKRLYDQARYQRQPQLDSDAVFHLLTLCYPLDPASVLKETYVVQVGDVAVCSAAGARVLKYHQPVPDSGERYKSIDECVEHIDGALRETIRRRLDPSRVPLVMLSGGIDSLVMLRYLSELAPGSVESLTFSVEGAARSEAVEGAIASTFYGSRHHELLVDRRSIAALTRRAIVEGEGPGYGGYLGVAQQDWLEGQGRPFDVYRGEDSRIHTPPLDALTKLGLRLNAMSIARHPVVARVWTSREALRRWPSPLLRKYFNYACDRTSIEPSLGEYIARHLCRYHVPDGLHLPMPSQFRVELERCAEAADMDEMFRRFISLSWRLQHTDDCHRAEAASVTPLTRLETPFFHPDVVDALARVPVSMATRLLLVGPSKTRSPFPFADKYVLRKLMKGNAPPELLYRHKTTAPAMDVQFLEAAEDSILPILREWGGDVEGALDGAARVLAVHYRARALAAGAEVGADWPTGWAACGLVFLAVLVRLMREPQLNLDTALEALPRTPDHRAASALATAV